MGRKKRAPVNQRAIWIYLETPEDAKRWKKEAEKVGLSASNFVRDIVDTYLRNGTQTISNEETGARLNEAIEEIKQLRVENSELTKKLERMDTLLNRYEEQIREFNTEKTEKITTKYEGEREIEKTIIELIKKHNYITEEKILDLLKIKPTDSKTIRILNEQIDSLLEYGLIKQYKGGYLWQR